MAVDLSKGPYAVEWAAVREHNRLKRVEKLAEGIVNVILGLTSDERLFGGEVEAWIEQLQSDARVLRAEIMKGAA